MKRITIISVLTLVSLFARSQSFEVQRLLLDWQKLTQERKILSDMYDSYEILSKGYNAIRDICKGSFQLHKDYLDGLLAVSPQIRSYARVAAIAELAAGTITLYQQSWSAFKSSPFLRAQELALLSTQLSAVMNETGDITGALTTVLTDGLWRASDAERLETIDALYDRMRTQYTRLTEFTNRTSLLLRSRNNSQAESAGLQVLFGSQR